MLVAESLQKFNNLAGPTLHLNATGRVDRQTCVKVHNGAV